ncbi:hypothetical protein HN51_011989 [Arachis hypogaea]
MSGSSSPPSSSSIRKYNGISGASTVSFNPDTSKYTIKFDGKEIVTTVTDKATIVEQWIQDINAIYEANSSVIVGIDVERGLVSGIGSKSATLHLCIDNKCLILQLLHIDNLPLSLKYFLTNPNFFFVGFGVDRVISMIKTDYGLKCGVHADIMELAKEKWPYQYNIRSGLKDLAINVVGLKMKKPKLSNWKSRVLSIEQVEYACVDAYGSYKIGHKLLKNG